MKKRVYIFGILFLVTLLVCSCGKKKQDAEIKNTPEVTESEKESTKEDFKEEGSEGEELEDEKTEEKETEKKGTEEISESKTDNQQSTAVQAEQSNSNNSSTQGKTQTPSGQITANTNDSSKVPENSSSSESNNTSGDKASNGDLKAESESNASKYNSYYQEVLRLVNQIRAEAGVAPMVLDDTLCKAASMRAVEMDYYGYFSHTRPNGESCFSVLSDYNISYYKCGENIAAGYKSPAAVVEGWKNSPGHYANMIDPGFGKLGVGYSESFNTNSPQWVQLFTD